MSVFTLAIQFTLFDGPNIPGSYAVLFFTALDVSSITSHIHNWALTELLDRKQVNALLQLGIISCFLILFPSTFPLSGEKLVGSDVLAVAKVFQSFEKGFFPPVKINHFLDLITYPEKSQPCHARLVPYNGR